MDENRDDKPLSSEELLRRAREGLGESERTPPAPADFSIESFPPPAADTPVDEVAEPTVFADPEPDFAPAAEPAASPFEPDFTPRDEPASWAPPPADGGAPSDWSAQVPTGHSPEPARRSGIGGKLWILVVIAVVGFGVFSLLDSSKTVDDIAVGDCMNIPDEDVFSTVDTIDCNEPHDLEVYALVDLSEVSPQFSSVASFPGDDAVYEAAFNACWDEFESYIGVPYEESVLYLDAFTPTLEGWDERGDRIANCVVYAVNQDATGLIQSNRSLRNANR